MLLLFEIRELTMCVLIGIYFVVALVFCDEKGIW